MGSEPTLWLYPLILITLVLLVVYIRIGFAWTWGFCLQALTIFMVAVAGLFVLPAWAGFCALAGWALFGLAVVVPRAVLAGISRDLMYLDWQSALSRARLLRWFFWGRPGRFWLDMASYMSLSIQGNKEAAATIIEQWSQRSLPKETRSTLYGYSLTGRILTRDWDEIISSYESIAKSSANLGQAYSICLAVMRAYLEKGRIKEALACLKAAEIAGARLTAESLETAFLSFFTLTGAVDELDAVLDELHSSGHRLPEYANLRYQGRCLIIAGRINEGVECLRRSLELIPERMTSWRERTREDIERALRLDAAAAVPDWSSQIQEAKAIREHARALAEIISPSRRCWAVNALILLIVVAYVASHLGLFIASPSFAWLTEISLRWGILDPAAVASGQYWRVLSYLFLHRHISHLVLNLIGLWWFGRMAENLYGSFRFLAIYFISGCVSGLAHTIFCPILPAIGASGAVMGVFGAMATGIFRLKGWMPERVRRFEVSWMLGLAAAQIVLDQIIPNVAFMAHLGGLVAGLALGLMVPLRLPAGTGRPPDRSQAA